jgi:hypothetical protein
VLVYVFLFHFAPFSFQHNLFSIWEFCASKEMFCSYHKLQEANFTCRLLCTVTLSTYF